jgi:hypothetical protein
MTFCLGGATESPQSVAHSTEEFFNEVLFRTEMVEQDWCLRSECDSQRPQRQLRNAVRYDVVDGSLQKFLAAFWIGRSRHHRGGTGQAGRRDSD